MPATAAAQTRCFERTSVAPSMFSLEDVASPAALRRICFGLLALGVVWRITLYAMQFPIWGDEAYVCLNFLDEDYVALTGPLKCAQIAPLLFLWSELTVYRVLGGSELAVRLLPLLAGLAALPLFWRLCWRTLPPLAATFAVGLLSVSFWPTAMCCVVKPYTFDLLTALALLVSAVEWLHEPTRRGWLWLLAILCPIAIFSSYPVVFVAGAVSLALLPAVWREGGWTGRVLYLSYNVGMCAAFVVHFRVIAVNQLSAGGGAAAVHLADYWEKGFPPAHPLSFLWWLVLMHTGRMACYPIGDADGGSVATTIVVLIGLVQLLRGQWNRRFAMLLLAPFALNFIASVMHKYPYGGCCRLSQHLAPAVCCLAGLGIAWLIERGKTRREHGRGVLGFAVLLGLVPIGGVIYNCNRPYWDSDAYRARGMVRDFFAQVPPGQPVVVMNDRAEIDAVHQWLLARRGERVTFDADFDPAVLNAVNDVWILRFRAERLPPLTAMPIGQKRRPAAINPDDLGQRLGMRAVMACDGYHWVRVNGEWRLPPSDVSRFASVQ